MNVTRKTESALNKKTESVIAPTAADLVLIAESIVLGGEHAGPVTAAAAAVGATLSAASAGLFRPAVSAVHADAGAIALLNWHQERAGTALGAKLVQVHKLALSEQPALAALARTAEILEAVHEAAAAGSGSAGGPHLESIAAREQRVGAAAVRKFQVEIAAQLVEAGIESSAAKEFLAAVELEQRVAAIRERHAAHATDAAQRAEAEARAAVQRAVAARIAEVNAAGDAFKAATQEAERAGREYRELRAAVLVERIRASGAESLTHGRRIWATSMIIGENNTWGLEQLAEFEEALASHEANAA